MTVENKPDNDQQEIELLAPARDLECGIAAIEHGADAVYIGGPNFSARSAAGNSFDDISTLIQFAHQYRARVYIALNTILNDDEIKRAAEMIHRFHEMHADAVIIQDMGLLECDLPPVPLHASTQVNIRSVEKVQFLEAVGFQQVVLARELSLEQISAIAKNTSVTLESFVHGALCVSYSGQCYISQVMTGRSANRGECAQFCRHTYNLKDAEGRIIEKDKHLLSLKDLNLLQNLQALITAGVRSFKIEGRLKDSSYVKNITGLYRQKLDSIIEKSPHLKKSSSGHVTLNFQPDAKKTFHRGETSYYLLDHKSRPAELRTPKSTGELVGTVQSVGDKHIVLKKEASLQNGDGLCYFDSNNNLVGFRLNVVENKKIFPAKMVRPIPMPGTRIFRNFDKKFHQQLSVSSRCRKIDVRLEVNETADGISLTILDEDQIESNASMIIARSVAQKPEVTLPSIEKQVRKSGDTIFNVQTVTINVDPANYYSPSKIKELRRRAFANHLEKRDASYRTTDIQVEKNDVVWPGGKVGYLDNIANIKSRDFYQRHGALFSDDHEIRDLMTCKYCIKAQLNLCPEKGGNTGEYKEPFVLQDNTGEYKLIFNCKKCEMIVRQNNSGSTPEKAEKK